MWGPEVEKRYEPIGSSCVFPQLKNYVVAGQTYCGTTAMMLALMSGGIKGHYRTLKHPDRAYPYQVFEAMGGKLKYGSVLGNVVKQFDSTLVDNIPRQITNIHVVYMVRDYDARHLAHPQEPASLRDYWDKHLTSIQRISQDDRVAQLVVIDFDQMIDDPEKIFSMLLERGWDIDSQLAWQSIKKSLRHGKIGWPNLINHPAVTVEEDKVTVASALDEPVVYDAPTDAASLRIVNKWLKKRARIA